MKEKRTGIILMIGLSVVPGASILFSMPPAQLTPAGAGADAPLYFIPNRGQTAPDVLFYAQQPGMTLWLTERGLVFDRTDPTPDGPHRSVSRLTFQGGRPEAEVTALDPTPYAVSYFYGADEAGWRTGLPTSGAVLYRNLYDGIDLKLYGNGRRIEYDWVVRPGADPARIRFAWEGDRPAGLDAEGNLVFGTIRNGFKMLKPETYQVIAGRRVEVASSFRELEKGLFGFEVAAYDRDNALIIDPLVILYWTYLGGRGLEWAYSVAVDKTGAAYVFGYTESLDFPPVKVTKPRQDVFVTKLAPDGKSLVYSAFFPSTIDQARLPKLAVDGAGAVYLAGIATSRNFPIKNAFQKTFKGDWADAFFLKLAPSGKSLVFSSFLGGKSYDSGLSIAVDAAGYIYVSGQTESGDFPIKNAFQSKLGGFSDVFITKFKPDGRTLVFSTYLGSLGFDTFGGLAVDSQGAVFVAGGTSGPGLPLKNPFQKKYGGGYDDAFISKLAPSGDKLAYSSYLGGPRIDRAWGLAIDGTGAAYVVGTASLGFPVKNAFQKTYGGGFNDTFIAKVSPDGSKLVYASYLGGSAEDPAYDVAVDGTGTVYVVGSTASFNFPLKNPYMKHLKGSSDCFLTAVAPNGRSLVLSTYLGGEYRDEGGGVAMDSAGNLYFVCTTNSPDLPVYKAYQKSLAGIEDGCVLKLKIGD
jgi:hypothetical protein